MLVTYFGATVVVKLIVLQIPVMLHVSGVIQLTFVCSTVMIFVPNIKTDECEYRCYLDANCVSLNIRNKDHDSGTHKCELNNSTHLEHEGDLQNSPLYYYRGAEVSD